MSVATLRLAALAAWFAALPAAAATFAGVEVPPPLPARPVVDLHWGVAVEDPYRFLEDTADAGVQKWMRAQADATRSILDRLPGRAALAARVAEIDAAASAAVSAIHRDGRGRLTYLKRGADESQFKLYRRDATDAPERLLVDPEAVAKATGRPHAIGAFRPSPDGERVAYSLSASGAEIGTLHVLDVASGKEVTAPIDRIRGGGVAWLPDGSGFFYGRLAPDWQKRPRSEQFQDRLTYLRRLGAAGEDPAVFGPGVHADIALDRDEGAYVVPVEGRDLAVAVVARGVQRELALYQAPLSAVVAGTARWRKVFDASAQVHGIAAAGPWLYLRSAQGAPRFKLLRTPVDAPDLAKATAVVPEGDGVLTGFAAARDGVYLTRREGVAESLARLTHDAEPALRRVALPFEGSVGLADSHPTRDGVLVTLGSWTRAAKHHAADASGEVRPLALAPAGRFDDAPGVESREVRVRSHDGVEVPVSILLAKGTKLDGRNPLVLYGYGAYGNVEEPGFSPRLIAWLERGGIYAIAHVRGGGVHGDAWRRAGWKATKPNTWKDGIAAAEWLVAGGYTSRDRLVVSGGSAGGIFAGRAITERPDLFAAALVSVGNVDSIRSETRANGVGNIPEYGTVKKEDEFHALLAMSPYANVKAGTRYPAVMLDHGVNDTRVDVWMSLKFASRLAAATSADAPVLLRLDYDSGHGPGRTREQARELLVDRYSFALWRAGHPDFQPAGK
ncbi:MAG: prolyl oligopeptidase family serine peptidase [Betaproteobacteria bacterium]|nr:prolyl oligopeptidase family serine peptidase [Betaproteobacteria bacterium]